jgi:hypothetical protein
MRAVLKRRRTLAVALLIVVTCGGCVSQPDSSEAKDSMRSSRETIIAHVRDVAEVLSADGRVTDAGGAWSSCGSAPTYGLEYAGGAKVSGQGSQADRLRQAVEALEQAGWRQTDVSYAADPRPYARLEKDGQRLSVDTDALRGSDALTYGLRGRCVRVTKEQANVFYDRDRIDVAG